MTSILRNCIVCKRDDADRLDNGIVWSATAADCNHAICRQCAQHVLNAVLDVYCAGLRPCASSAQIAGHITAIAATSTKLKHPDSLRTQIRTAAFKPLPGNAALDAIAAERRRQYEVDAWTAAHDDTHTEGELAAAAAYYANPTVVPELYPWPGEDNRGNHTRTRELVIAGALIVAELERLQRAGHSLQEASRAL